MSQPSLSTTDQNSNLPVIGLEKDIKLIAEFARQQGAKVHEQMLETLMKTNSIEVYSANLNGVILAIRVFQRVINPMRGAMGYALLEDWSNGFVGLEPLPNAGAS